MYAYHLAAPDVSVGYYLIGGDNDSVSLFKINICSGQLRLVNPGTLSFARKSSIRLLIQVLADNSVASFATANVTVRVLAVPHAPSFNDTPGTSWLVRENATIGTVIYPGLAAFDIDNDNFTFAVVPNAVNQGYINISTTGKCPVQAQFMHTPKGLRSSASRRAL